MRTVPGITSADVRSRIYLIADDSMGGREAGAPGNYAMTSYLAKEMARLKLEPGGENGTWFQVIPMVRRQADSTSALIVKGRQLALFRDFALIRPTATVRFTSSLAPGKYPTAYGGRLGDSTVALLDVAGKFIVFDAPLDSTRKPTGVYNTPAASAIARYPAAAGILISSLDIVTAASRSSLRGRGPGLSEANASRASRPFGMVISADAARTIMGAPLASVTPGTRGADVQAAVRFSETPVASPARNVIAILRGSDPVLRGQFVAIGAHSDHIAPAARAVDHDSLRAWNRVMRPNGADSRGAGRAVPTAAELTRIHAVLDSVRKLHPPRRDSIYNGADDDGSGSTALLEIAESLSGRKAPRRSTLFVWHTAEESGLLGSAWFAENTTVPHDSIVAQLNMDMVGRGTAMDTPRGGPRNVQIIGSRRLSTDLGDLVDSVNARRNEPYVIDYSFDAPRHVQNRYCRSDHYMYARSGIPIAYISRGYHEDYHMVTDEPQYIDYEGLARVAGFVRDIAVAIANRSDRVRVDKPKPNSIAPCRQ
ncbi:MAG: M28 family peptidase [Gemmatimonadales bacterium]